MPGATSHRAAICSNEEGAQRLRQAGAQPVLGDIYQPQMWIDEVRGSAALIDLTQPKLPQRLSRTAMQAISQERQAMTRSVLEALRSLPADERPLFFSISGADDLRPDMDGVIRFRSSISTQPRGFAHIGIPVRKLVEASGLDATYIYLGNLVYGPGKVFADTYVAGLKKGLAPVIGKGTNRLPLTHVTDAARALVYLAGLPGPEIVSHTFLAMDGADTTQRELLNDTASYMGVKKPSAIPTWLAALVAGPIAVETMTFDAHVDNSALLETGFHFLYPSYREGVVATLAQLGYGTVGVSDEKIV